MNPWLFLLMRKHKKGDKLPHSANSSPWGLWLIVGIVLLAVAGIILLLRHWSHSIVP